MKKGLYYCRIHRKDPINLGAVKKSHGLMSGFRQLGYEMDIIWYGSEGIFLNEQVIFRFPLSTDSSACGNILFHHLMFDAVIAHQVDFRQYGFLWLRYPLSHPGFILLLKKAKSENPALKIILEVPTYPYHLELSTPLRKIQYWLDRRCSPFLKRYVDWTVHYGKFTSLFGIPSISIRNGIEIDSVPVSKSIAKAGVIRLIAAGNWNLWHGLDRLIDGLENYCSNPFPFPDVQLTVVGGGREINAYKRSVEAKGLADKVHFLPPTTGEALNVLFDDADVGIGSLGLFRLELTSAAPLKHREYCARGIPFVLSTLDDAFPPGCEWVCYFPEREEPISIEELVAFFNQLNLTEIRLDMRAHALSNFPWSVILKKVMKIVVI